MKGWNCICFTNKDSLKAELLQWLSFSSRWLCFPLKSVSHFTSEYTIIMITCICICLLNLLLLESSDSYRAATRERWKPVRILSDFWGSISAIPSPSRERLVPAITPLCCPNGASLQSSSLQAAPLWTVQVKALTLFIVIILCFRSVDGVTNTKCQARAGRTQAGAALLATGARQLSPWPPHHAGSGWGQPAAVCLPPEPYSRGYSH